MFLVNMLLAYSNLYRLHLPPNNIVMKINQQTSQYKYIHFLCLLGFFCLARFSSTITHDMTDFPLLGQRNIQQLMLISGKRREWPWFEYLIFSRGNPRFLESWMNQNQELQNFNIFISPCSNIIYLNISSFDNLPCHHLVVTVIIITLMIKHYVKFWQSEAKSSRTLNYISCTMPKVKKGR